MHQSKLKQACISSAITTPFSTGFIWIIFYIRFEAHIKVLFYLPMYVHFLQCICWENLFFSSGVFATLSEISWPYCVGLFLGSFLCSVGQCVYHSTTHSPHYWAGILMVIVLNLWIDLGEYSSLLCQIFQFLLKAYLSIFLDLICFLSSILCIIRHTVLILVCTYLIFFVRIVNNTMLSISLSNYIC